MKRNITALLIPCLLLFSCSNTPEEYFGKAALNCNLLYGFAGYELNRDLATPAEKLTDEKTLKTTPMKRIEVVQEKLARVQENYEQVKALGSNAGAAAMIKASLALYEYVLPVYKNEYMQLAQLYDSGAPAGQITAMEKSIGEKYEPEFLRLYESVWAAAKPYAQQHGIRVKEVNPSPPN